MYTRLLLKVKQKALGCRFLWLKCGKTGLSGNPERPTRIIYMEIECLGMSAVRESSAKKRADSSFAR